MDVQAIISKIIKRLKDLCDQNNLSLFVTVGTRSENKKEIHYLDTYSIDSDDNERVLMIKAAADGDMQTMLKIMAKLSGSCCVACFLRDYRLFLIGQEFGKQIAREKEDQHAKDQNEEVIDDMPDVFKDFIGNLSIDWDGGNPAQT